MHPAIRNEFGHSQVIDITTRGRTSGQPRRIEIVFHSFDGRIYVSGMPHSRRRSWLANLEADPNLTVHLKGAVTADVPATAREITDPDERRAVLERIARAWRRTDVDRMVAESPLVELTIPALAVATPA
jgi:deazaflavin-dependent oxidoreductase (nitroreductase family)